MVLQLRLGRQRPYGRHTLSSYHKQHNDAGSLVAVVSLSLIGSLSHG